MTMMIWANPYKESDNLGTDLYDNDFKLVKTIKYLHNNGYFFSSGEDTWHGLELKEIKKKDDVFKLIMFHLKQIGQLKIDLFIQYLNND